MSDPGDHETCNKVIADLESKIIRYNNFMEFQLLYANKMIPENQKYGKLISEIREFLNKENGTNNQ